MHLQVVPFRTCVREMQAWPPPSSRMRRSEQWPQTKERIQRGEPPAKGGGTTPPQLIYSLQVPLIWETWISLASYAIDVSYIESLTPPPIAGRDIITHYNNMNVYGWHAER